MSKRSSLRLRSWATSPWLPLVAVGDVMTGMRMRHRIRRHGPDYVCASVRPLLDRAAVVMGNLEGPFAAVAEQQDTTRNFSYKVDPSSASTLRRAGFDVMTVANNHITDCGRDGVSETLETLAEQGIAVIGGGPNQASTSSARGTTRKPRMKMMKTAGPSPLSAFSRSRPQLPQVLATVR